MMYRWSVCDPFVDHVIEKGSITKEEILSEFRDFPWEEYLERMQAADEKEIHFSPSLEFEHVPMRRALVFSAVQEREGFVFYIFYKRPEQVKKFFGLIERENPGYVSDLIDQSFESAHKILEEFVAGDYETVRSHFS